MGQHERQAIPSTCLLMAQWRSSRTNSSGWEATHWMVRCKMDVFDIILEPQVQYPNIIHCIYSVCVFFCVNLNHHFQCHPMSGWQSRVALARCTGQGWWLVVNHDAPDAFVYIFFRTTRPDSLVSEHSWRMNHVLQPSKWSLNQCLGDEKSGVTGNPRDSAARPELWWSTNSPLICSWDHWRKGKLKTTWNSNRDQLLQSCTWFKYIFVNTYHLSFIINLST